MKIKDIEKHNIDDVVSIHKDAFKGFFLTDLGDEFLHLYYRCILQHPLGILHGCFEENQLVGFSASTKHSRGFNRKLIVRNFLSFSKFGIKFLFSNIKVLIRLKKNLSKSHSDFEDNGDYAELLSIGVKASQQGKGIGKMLLTDLEKELKKDEILKVSLTTDFEDNESAIGFYLSLGYEIYYDFIVYPNRRMYRMIKQI